MVASSELQLIFWNAQSIRKKKLEFFTFLKRESIDISFISETFLTHNDSCYDPEYYTFRLDRPNRRGGGVALFVKKNIKCTLLPVPKTKVIESIAVEMFCANHKITFVSVYYNGSTDQTETQLFREDIRILYNLAPNLILAGDLNSKHNFWNCNRNNLTGNILYQEMNAQGFIIHFPDSPTHFPHNRNQPSTIDLMITKGSPIISNLSTLNEFSSDHFPVKCKLFEHVNYETMNDFYKDFKNANWSAYSRFINLKCLEPNPTELNSPEDIENAVHRFCEILSEADLLYIPRNQKTFSAISLPNDILALIGQRKAKNRMWKRTQNMQIKRERDFLSTLIEQKIKDRVNNNFSNLIETLNSDPGNYRKRFWKISRILKTKKKPIPPLILNDDTLITNAEKSETLANYFESIHQLTLQDSTNSHDRIIETTASRVDLDNIEDNSFNPINLNEIRFQISRSKNNKAPGLDCITNQHLKQLPDSAISLLMFIFNACFFLSYFPKIWKTAIIKSICKPGKDPHLISSYRPISLLSSVGKIFERLILEKLNSHIEGYDIIKDHQYGFRKEKSSVHQLFRVSKNIEKQIRSRKSVGMLSLDLQSAFDTVWHDGLLYKMKNLQFPIFLVKIVKSFLQDRKFSVNVEGTKSLLKSVVSGVPQGAVMSPILFNIFINDFPTVKQVDLAQFADDSAYFTTSHLTSTITNRLQKTANKVARYCKKWRIKLNGSKSESMLFTQKTAIRHQPTIPVVINNENVEWKNEIKYLGMKFDKRMKFHTHVDFVLGKSEKVIKALYPLINRNSRLNEQNKLLLFKTVFRPIFTYGAPVWAECATTHKQKIQIHQNKILKMMLNKHWRTSTVQVHNLAGVEYIDEHIQNLKTKFINKLALNVNEDIANLRDLI